MAEHNQSNGRGRGHGRGHGHGNGRGAAFASGGRRLFDYALAGTAGALIVRGAEALSPRVRPAAYRALVATVAASLAAARRLEEVAEETRLRSQDVVADARERLGEEARPPADPRAESRADDGHTH